MKTLTVPGTRRRVSPYERSHLLAGCWSLEAHSGYGIRTQGDGWCQGRLTPATQGAREPNQPLTGDAHLWTSLLMFPRFSSFAQDIAGEYVKSLFFFLPFTLLRSENSLLFFLQLGHHAIF